MQPDFVDPRLWFTETVLSMAKKYELSGCAEYKKIISAAAGDLPGLRPVAGKGGCFVAGTLVRTDKGLVPIEKIRVGDMVLSQPDEGGELSYKPVVNTFVQEDKEVWLVEYVRSNDLEPAHLVVTEGHPVFVKDIGWTAAEYLKGGQWLKLHNDPEDDAFVVSVLRILTTKERDVGWTAEDTCDVGPTIDLRNNLVKVSPYRERCYNDFDYDEDYLRCRVFNIEVADFHTYYVGEYGVWVHNTGCCVE